MKTGFRFEAVPIKYKTGSMKMYDNSRFSLSSQSLSNQYSTSYNNKMLSKTDSTLLPELCVNPCAYYSSCIKVKDFAHHLFHHDTLVCSVLLSPYNEQAANRTQRILHQFLSVAYPSYAIFESLSPS